MLPSAELNGRQRVAIEGVWPEIDGGRFASTAHVDAPVLTEVHPVLAAALVAADGVGVAHGRPSTMARNRSRDSLFTTKDTSSTNRRTLVLASLRTRSIRFSMSSL